MADKDDDEWIVHRPGAPPALPPGVVPLPDDGYDYTRSPTARITVRPPGKWGPDEERTWQGVRTVEDLPQIADDTVRAAANTITFGGADRLAAGADAAFGTGTYEENLKAELLKSAQARSRSPVASVAGDAAGTLALPSRLGPALATRFGSGAGARAAGYGAEGALIGAAQGAGNTYTGNPADYAKNATMGGVLGGVTGGVGGAAFGPRAPVSSARRPTLPEQARGTDVAYNTLRANPAAYGADHFGRAADALEQRLLNEGYIRNYSPGSFTAVDRMRTAQGNPNAVVTPANVDLVRRGINRIPRGELSATDRSSGRIVKQAIDDFLINPPPGSIRPGSGPAAATAAHQAQTARDMAATQYRMQKMADMRQAAENQAAASWSGLNVENSIRGQVKNFINPNTGGRQRLEGYTAAEQAALRDIVHRGGVANVGRWAGNIAAGGGGLAVPVVAMAGGEALKLDPTTAAAIPLAGLALRGISNRSARNTIARAEDLIAQRSPLYVQRAATAPMTQRGLSSGQTQTLRDAIALQMIDREYRE